METVKSLENLSLEKNLNLKQVYLDTQIKTIIDILEEELVGLIPVKTRIRNFLSRPM